MPLSSDARCSLLSHREERCVSWAFLRSPYAPLVTHFCLVGLTGALFAMVLLAPLWVAVLPCIVIRSRIVVLLHDYLHGIPFLNPPSEGTRLDRKTFEPCSWN